MDLTLTRNPSDYQELFRNLGHPKDVADLLEVPYQTLNYWIYATNEDKRYTTFHIPKKTGGHRQIDVPNDNINILQQKLNTVLQSVYRVRPSAHGFVTGRSVKSNAQQHIQKFWVFNLDLDNFFHTIHFGRVRGMFMANPYNLPERVATVLAHLCCHQGRLAQGAPTSPVVSNMICAKMDSQLQRLAHDTRSWYTRYADDITFSTRRKRFPTDLASLNELGQVQIGHRLVELIEQNGFMVNRDKVRLRGQHQRQEVTGVTVNDITNVPKRFANQIRAMLYAWKRFGLEAAQRDWEEKYDHKNRGPGHSAPRFELVLKGKIEYLGMIKGHEAPTYLKFMDQLGDLDSRLAHGRGTPLHLLLRKYRELEADSSHRQGRGYQFEDVMNELFTLCGVAVSKSFTRNDGGEQIDGAFELDGSYYLVECKWREALTRQAEVDAFSGKIGRSGDHTGGLFISVNGWTDHVLGLTKQNRDKSVFFMDGLDVSTVLSGELDFIDLLREKINALNIKAEPFVSAKSIIGSRQD